MSHSNRLRNVMAALLLAASLPAFSVQPKVGPDSVSPVESVVEAQLDAYNRRDLEAFLASYSDDVVLAKYPNVVTQTGKAEMRARYQRNFSNPNIRAEILGRIVFGNTVIDHEKIIVPPANRELEAVAVYEVAGGKIVRVTFIEKAPAAP